MPTTTLRGTRRRCGHCHGSAPAVACATCNRAMCADCVSYGDAGKVCGLCRDREVGRARWAASGSPLDFDEWYDQHG